MNAKNLPLKFAFVGLLAALSLWSILMGSGLRLGIDLRGGHSLIYGIMDNDAEIAQLNKRKKNLEDRLAAVDREAERSDIRGKLRRIDAEIKRLQSGRGEEGDLVNRMIAILKNRVDPRGLMNLEWRPLGSNKFEVRMPAGDPQTAALRKAYEDALEELEERNVEPYEIRSLERSAPEQRAAKIGKLAGANEHLAQSLRELVKLYEQLERKEKDLRQAEREGEADRVGKLQDEISKLKVAHANQRDAVMKHNVSRARLVEILKSYVSPAERQGGKIDEEELTNREQAYKNGLKDLKTEHPGRTEEIEEIDRKYRAWARQHRHLEDPSDLERLIAKAGALEFRIAPPEPGKTDSPWRDDTQVDEYRRKLREPGGPAEMRAANEPYLWFPIVGDVSGFDGLVTGLDHQGKPYVLLYNQPEHMMLNEGPSGWRLTGAYETTDNKGLPAVGFSFDELGAERFSRLTAAHKGWQMAILLDDQVYSAPTIRAVISDRGIIEMGTHSDPNEVQELVRTLDAGALPGKLIQEPLSESTFGPAIGEENKKRGIRAAFMGLIAVAAFMLIYYLLAGMIADVALMLNIILVLGAMSLLNAVFTLPGIAGVILTIGIAVDANVLIFERLREEQAKGQSLRMALKNAYERAFTAIFDANITTLITCLILGWIGTEEVRGFAITLGLGVAFSLFTALVVTRWVFQTLLDSKLVTRPIKMLSIVGVPRINWMGKRYVFWAVSGALIVMGIASLVRQGGDIWGIEFSAGTKATFQFRDDAVLGGELPNDRVVRELFVATARKGNHDKLSATARVETLKISDQAKQFMSRRDSDKDGRISRAEWRAQKLNESAFALIDRNADGSISREEAEAMPSLTYQLSTTETHVPTIRDVAAAAFGDAQERRPKRTFTLVRDETRKVLGLPISATGRTRIEAVGGLEESDLLEKFAGGAMFVIRVDQAGVDEAELRDRIKVMRFQSDLDKDFQGLAQNKTEVRLLDTDAKGRPEFAVLVRPREEPAEWDEFAQREQKLLTAALHREEALTAVNFDAAIAGETAQRAAIAVILSWLAIVGYLWLRFGSIQWGLAAVICLIHDVIIVVGLVAVSGWLQDTFLGRGLLISSFKIDLAMVAAVLTVIGYSVNDTIVVFDRIRENRGKLTTISPSVINTSINQTLARTLLTSGTTFIVVFIMYVWGGQGIRPFNYALLAGILFGTYSSVAVASPLLLGFRRALVARTAGAESATE